jgi:hypothetical protein
VLGLNDGATVFNDELLKLVKESAQRVGHKSVGEKMCQR